MAGRPGPDAAPGDPQGPAPGGGVTPSTGLRPGSPARNAPTAGRPDPLVGGDADEAALADRAKEFGQFLRSRRARISPEAAGFPVGSRRRSAGLRREEVAVLAGLSPTWYAYLEQGRKIRPSPEVLDSLASVLALTEDERRYMHLLALGHPPTPTSSVTSPSLDLDQLWSLMEVIGNTNSPVYIGNQYADILTWNEAATSHYTDFGAIPPERRNMLLWLLTSPEARERIVDWAEDTRDVVARLRSAYAVRSQDPRFQERVQHLIEVSPEFREWWSEHEVTGQRARLRTFKVAGLGQRSFRMLALRLADDGFASAIVHVPVAAADLPMMIGKPF